MTWVNNKPAPERVLGCKWKMHEPYQVIKQELGSNPTTLMSVQKVTRLGLRYD
jgi:hypothetical protein